MGKANRRGSDLATGTEQIGKVALVLSAVVVAPFFVLLLVGMLATGGFPGVVLAALLAFGLPLWKALAN